MGRLDGKVAIITEERDAVRDRRLQVYLPAKARASRMNPRG
jgi:hypothetical protein